VAINLHGVLRAKVKSCAFDLWLMASTHTLVSQLIMQFTQLLLLATTVFLLILMLAARQSSKPRQVSYSPLNSVLNLFLAALPAFNLCIVAWWICNKHYFLLMPINLLLSSRKMLLFKPQRAYNPKNWFWPGINLYIALRKIPQKFLHLVETSIFC